MSAGTISESDFRPALINEGEDQRIIYQQVVQGANQVSIVFSTAHISPWQVETIKRILEFKDLPDNWDSYGSQAPTEIAREKAIEFIFTLPPESPQPTVLPLSGGAVQIGLRRRGRGVQLEFLPDGSIEYLLIHGGEPVDDGGVLPFLSPTVVNTILNWLIAS